VRVRILGERGRVVWTVELMVVVVIFLGYVLLN